MKLLSQKGPSLVEGEYVEGLESRHIQQKPAERKKTRTLGVPNARATVYVGICVRKRASLEDGELEGLGKIYLTEMGGWLPGRGLQGRGMASRRGLQGKDVEAGKQSELGEN